MHGAGVDRALRNVGPRRRLFKIPCGIGRELRLAAGRTEVIAFAPVFDPKAACGRIDRHSADGVDDRRGSLMRTIMVVMVMTMGAIMTKVTTMIRRGAPFAAAAGFGR